MKSFSLSTIAVFMAAYAASPALATNCNGSPSCTPGSCGANALSAICTTIYNLAAAAPNNKVFAGQHIACNKAIPTNPGGCCAFYQGTSGTYASARDDCRKLLDSGCKGCGSTGHDDGSFTVNYVAYT